MKGAVYVGLVHWPVKDGAQNIVCTNVTNFDIHDIARCGRTYGVKKYFIINRLREQLMYVERVKDHWRVGRGARLNPMRGSALQIVETAETVEDALRHFEEPPLLVATAARHLDSLAPMISFRDLRLKELKKPLFLLFGTGFGLSDEVIQRCDYLLEPIQPHSPYRHLSVRSAVSICLDRLLGEW